MRSRMIDHWLVFGKQRGKVCVLFVLTTTHLSTPAHAIMTPLSVHHLGGGKTSDRPSDAASLETSPRMNMLDATPPATTRLLQGEARWE